MFKKWFTRKTNKTNKNVVAVYVDWVEGSYKFIFDDGSIEFNRLTDFQKVVSQLSCKIDDFKICYLKDKNSPEVK